MILGDLGNFRRKRLFNENKYKNDILPPNNVLILLVMISQCNIWEHIYKINLGNFTVLKYEWYKNRKCIT